MDQHERLDMRGIAGMVRYEGDLGKRVHRCVERNRHIRTRMYRAGWGDITLRDRCGYSAAHIDLQCDPRVGSSCRIYDTDVDSSERDWLHCL